MSRSHRALAAAFSLSLAVLTGAAAPAQARTPPGHVSGEVGLGALGNELYTHVSAWLALGLQDVDLGLHLPLRMRFAGGAPGQRGDPMVPRREDWDEKSEWSRVLRFLTVDTWQHRVQARLGELTGAGLGHGTLVARYYNGLDIDHYHTGLQLGIDGGPVGLEALVDDVLAPELVAGRVYLRPSSDKRRSGSVVGATVAADLSAPWVTAADGAWALDAVRTPMVTRRPVVAWAVDLAHPVWQRRGSSATVYLDLAGLHAGRAPGGGFDGGLHLGGLLRLPGAVGRSDLDLRLEGRVLSGGWRPAWFDTFYAVERFHAAPEQVGPVVSKSAAAVAAPADLRPGGLISADLRGRHGGQASLALDWNPRDGAGVLAWLALPEVQGLQVRASYARRGLAAPADLLDLQHTIAQASLRYRVTGPWFAAVTAGRRWRMLDGPTGPRYRAEAQVTASAGAEARF